MRRRWYCRGELIGDIAEIEMAEDAVELGHVDVGNARVAADQQHVLVVLQQRGGEKLAEPEQTSGSSDSGSISRNLVWTKNTKPSFFGRYSSSFKNHLSSSNSWMRLRAVGLPFFIL